MILITPRRQILFTSKRRKSHQGQVAPRLVSSNPSEVQEDLKRADEEALDLLLEVVEHLSIFKVVHDFVVLDASPDTPHAKDQSLRHFGPVNFMKSKTWDHSHFLLAAI